MLTFDGLEFSVPGDPRPLLADHHAEIEAACEALRASTYTDDPPALVERFRRFEHAVIAHLNAEEEMLLPAYAEHAPNDASVIRATHEDLRRQLFRLGIDVELHCVRAAVVETLVQTLRAHAAHEDRGMYTWAQANLPLASRRELIQRIARSLRMLTRVRNAN